MTAFVNPTVARLGGVVRRALTAGMGIRSGAASETASPGLRTDDQATDGLGTAIGHLTVSAGIVRLLAARAEAAGDCARWAAAADADHAIHRALIVLQDIPLPADALAVGGVTLWTKQ